MTARDAARLAGADLAQIVKSLVFMCDERPVVVLVPGDARADAGKVARASGAVDARVASAEEVERHTGFKPGAVAPFPLRDIEVLLDRSLLVHDHVWVGAGSPNHLARLRSHDLLRLTRGRQMDAVADAAYDSA
jgi:Cys-tRNA(Pro)/Cys-tRNA(Cys) deacylase